MTAYQARDRIIEAIRKCDLNGGTESPYTTVRRIMSILEIENEELSQAPE